MGLMGFLSTLLSASILASATMMTTRQRLRDYGGSGEDPPSGGSTLAQRIGEKERVCTEQRMYSGDDQCHQADIRPSLAQSKSLDRKVILAKTFKYTHTLKENKVRFAYQQSQDYYVRVLQAKTRGRDSTILAKWGGHQLSNHQQAQELNNHQDSFQKILTCMMVADSVLLVLMAVTNSVLPILMAVADSILLVLMAPNLRWKNKKKDAKIERVSSIIDDFERGAGLRRFSYKEIVFAINDFYPNRRLGQGGFEAVYKGYFADLDLVVAVKKISSGSRQGKREYVTEVNVISRLRHQNLVQLIGWCHDQGEFLLVYEYMPNGSLHEE
nr:L-type lectin-domain containing receptor kinase IX.2-like [Arachis hypogaea]